LDNRIRKGKKGVTEAIMIRLLSAFGVGFLLFSGAPALGEGLKAGWPLSGRCPSGYHPIPGNPQYCAPDIPAPACALDGNIPYAGQPCCNGLIPSPAC
jgi:hypothetical protein